MGWELARLRALIVIAFSAFAANCSGDATRPGTPTHAFELDFSDADRGWTAAFANFPLGWEDGMQLESGHRPL